MQIKHSEFVAAITPLLELIGQDPNGLYVPTSIVVDQSDDAVLATITVLRAEDPGDGTEPVEHGDAPYTVKAWPLTVAVV